MDESKWARCRTPGSMVEYLIDSGASQRKLRLFAVACCRHSNQTYSDPREGEEERHVLDVAERFADGALTAEDLAAVFYCQVDSDSGSHWIVAEPDAVEAAETYSQSDRKDCKQGSKAALLRDLFGNPFQPVRFDPSWRTAQAISLAQAAYDERKTPRCELDPVRLTILADALEDAGCTDESILTHLRSRLPHMRGCWVVDAILGKS